MTTVPRKIFIQVDSSEEQVRNWIIFRLTLRINENIFALQTAGKRQELPQNAQSPSERFREQREFGRQNQFAGEKCYIQEIEIVRHKLLPFSAKCR